MGARALIKRYPHLKARLPMIPLGVFPTPAHPAAPALSERLSVDLWLKRDDESCLARYGGNKVRKLELLLAESATLPGGVITTGAWGSHHVLATAVHGREAGQRVCAVLVPQPRSSHVLSTLLATHGAGADVVAAPSAVHAGLAILREARRRKAYIIPPGGSSPLGALAYVGAAFELAEQIGAGICPEPERIYVPLGSSGTHAGLHLGARLAGLRTEVIGVRVTPRHAANEVTVAVLATRCLSLLRARGAKLRGLRRINPWQVNVVHHQIGAGYGHPTTAARLALDQARELTGLGLDLTYTAKAFAGLVADTRERPPRGPVLFWSTLSSSPLEPLLDGVSPEGLPPRLRQLYP